MGIWDLLSTWYFWLILSFLLLIFEVFTLGFLLACFSFGALLAVIPALIGLDATWSMLVFAIASIASILFLRPLILKVTNKSNVKIGMEAMIGRKVKVRESINNLENQGTVSVNGEVWNARSIDDTVLIPAGSIVEIVSYESIELKVKMLN